MNKSKIENFEDLFNLLKDYNNPLIVTTPEQERKTEGIFFDYVTIKYKNYLVKALSKFKASQEILPYDFSKSEDQETFIMDFWIDRIYPKKADENILWKLVNIETETVFKSYLYKSIDNAVLTLIQQNRRKEEMPKDNEILGDKLNNFITENEQKIESSFSKDLKELYEKEEMQLYPYIYLCNNLFNESIKGYNKIEINYDERLLKWRVG